jgi:hypothetical protein
MCRHEKIAIKHLQKCTNCIQKTVKTAKIKQEKEDKRGEILAKWRKEHPKK